MSHGIPFCLQLQKDHRPRYGLWEQLRPGHYYGPSGSVGHPDQYDPGSNMVLGHRHCLKWLARPQVSTWPFVVTEALYTNSDIGCCRAVNPDMDLGNSSDLDTTMSPNHQHGHR